MNSFGVGGANAHAVLDDAYHYLKDHGLVGYHRCVEAPSLSDAPVLNGGTPGLKLLVWSAADPGAVQRIFDAYQEYFGTHVAGHPRKLDQLAYTLATRRSIMAWRTFAVVEADTNEFVAAKAIRASSKCGIAFVFTGQGAQHPGMGLELRRYAVFEASLKRSDEILGKLGCEWSLLGESDPEQALTPLTRVTRPTHTYNLDE